MNVERKARLESLLLQELASFVPRAVKDPRIPTITITSVQLNIDGRQAVVYFSLLQSSFEFTRKAQIPDSELATDVSAEHVQIQKCIAGLRSASGFIRNHLAKTLHVRRPPDLVFQLDHGLDHSIRVHRLLSGLRL